MKAKISKNIKLKFLYAANDTINKIKRQPNAMGENICKPNFQLVMNVQNISGSHIPQFKKIIKKWAKGLIFPKT